MNGKNQDRRAGETMIDWKAVEDWKQASAEPSRGAAETPDDRIQCEATFGPVNGVHFRSIRAAMKMEN